MITREALIEGITAAIQLKHGYTQHGVGETVVSAIEALVGAQAPAAAPSDSAKASITQLCNCLEDVASGKGGWAWEEVLQEVRLFL